MSAAALETLALELFDQEYEREARRSGTQGRMRRAYGEMCPITWVMHELVQLVDENHTEPVEVLRPCIRRLIAERAFAFGPLDIDGRTDPQAALDAEVDLVIRTLERVRAHAFASGQWSAMDSSAELFVG